MENYEIVRKLETSEINKNRTVFGPNILTTIQIRSKVDLYANLDKVRNGIQSWKSMHKILRSKVIKQGDDFYYAIDENSSVNQNLENVKFLRVQFKSDSKKQLNEDLLYDLMFENYIAERIDFEKDHKLLWRLAILEVKKDNDEFVYEIFWFIHHMISDGLSVKENSLLLLDTIQKSIKGDEIEIKDFGMYPGTGRLFENEINSRGDLKERLPVYKPDFVDPDQAKLHASSSLDKYFKDINEIDDFQLIDLNRKGQVYASLEQLVRFVREESFQKVKKFFINENEYLKLTKKSKEEKVKITSLFNTLHWIAIFRLYKRHNSNLDEILSWTAVSLRKFRPETEINKYMLGYCVGSFFDSFRNVFKNVLDDSEVVSKFWGIARENDKSLTNKVENDMEKFGLKMKSPRVEDEMAVQTGLSNLGVLETSRVEENGLFKIENFYLQCYLPVTHVRLLFYHYAITIGNKMCWVITSNSHFFDHLFVDEFIELFNEILFKIVETI